MSKKYRQIRKGVLAKSAPNEIDVLVTIGKNQEIRYFTGVGVGKSTLMGVIAKTRTLKKP